MVNSRTDWLMVVNSLAGQLLNECLVDSLLMNGLTGQRLNNRISSELNC